MIMIYLIYCTVHIDTLEEKGKTLHQLKIKYTGLTRKHKWSGETVLLFTVTTPSPSLLLHIFISLYFFFLTVEVNFAHKTSKNRFLKCTECTRPFKRSPTDTLFTLYFSPFVYHLFPYSVFLVRLSV